MKVGVTGAFGLQGSRLATRLFDEGTYVKAFDSGERGLNRPRCDSSETVDLRTEIPDLNDLDVVFHLAARFGGVKYNHGAAELSIMLDNAAIDRNVIRAAVSSGVKRFVFASTGSVYPTRALTRKGGQLKETEPIDIEDLESGYACSKLATEAMLHRLHEIGQLPHLQVLRLFNVYGPDAGFQSGTHVIPELFRKTLSLDQEMVRVYGDGTQQRFFLYVDDAVEAYMACLTSAFDGVMNVGNPELVTIGDLARRIVRVCGVNKQLAFDLDKGGATVSLPCVPDISRARVALGWEPKVKLDDGLERTIRWIRHNNPAPLR